MKLPCIKIVICSFLFFPALFLAQEKKQNTSGGKLIPEQAAYDVKFYDLDVTIDPEKQTIKGTLEIRAMLLQPLHNFVLDLSSRLTVKNIREILSDKTSIQLSFVQKKEQIWIQMPNEKPKGILLTLQIDYAGQPKAAIHKEGSWKDGFVWAKTASGAPWIGVVSVLHGADLWWPCKDHPSDKPESMALHITVPQSLTVASNGKLKRITKNSNQTHTYHWYISTPISNYSVTLNIAPYHTFQGNFESICGQKIPISLWVLPENSQKGKKLFTQIPQHLKFFEELLGPYPFRIDKYGVAQTPYLGMENQTIISYGSKFNNKRFGKDWGFDWIHLHELSHEWWGNLITASDWKDWWIHEGFATYMEAIYVEKLRGNKAYHSYMNVLRFYIQNLKPVAPRSSLESHEAYTGDIYFKGAWILHSLRFLIGKAALYKTFQQIIYPTNKIAETRNGAQCRFINTAEVQATAEEISKQDLSWFFEVYLRQAELPELLVEQKEDKLLLQWKTPNNLPFFMPVQVQLEKELIQVKVSTKPCEIPLKGSPSYQIDPNKWILMKKTQQ